MIRPETYSIRGFAIALSSFLAFTACSAAQEMPAAPTISPEPIEFGPDAPFASEIYNFFVQDELFSPTACRTVFTGSSSIRFWLTLDEDFPELAPLNAGASPADVAERFSVFMDMKTERLGDAPVYFLSAKPSFARLDQLAEQTTANALIETQADARDDLIYVDNAPPMMDGDVPKQIFISDQLHMNLDGYAIWTDVLRQVLSDPDRPKRTGC